jgi:hypothetical protein
MIGPYPPTRYSHYTTNNSHNFMPQTKHALFTVGCLCLSLLASLAQNPAAPTEADKAWNKVLLKATSPYEDLVGPALAKDETKIAHFLVLADADAAHAAKLLPAASARRFEGLRQGLHTAAQAKDGGGVARQSVAIFRLLVDQLKADALTVPLEVELMDYAGYQLEVLAAAEQPDWKAISQLAAQTDQWWQAIAKPKVSNKQLRASVTSAVRGAGTAAQEQNRAMLKFAAQMVLDLVDVLEIQFKVPLAEKPVAPAAKP